MFILHDILEKLKNEFPQSEKAQERSLWFVYTVIAIIVPFSSSKTSNIIRCLKTLFGFDWIKRKKFYTFMASPKMPWKKLWRALWTTIPNPLTDERLLLALDDYINPKTGKKIFGCEKIFDHAAKQNQSKYPWAQNIVAVGLLKIVKGRWACLPLSFPVLSSKKERRENEPGRQSTEDRIRNQTGAGERHANRHCRGISPNTYHTGHRFMVRQ